MGALYSAVSDLLAVISRAYPQFLSPVPQNIIIALVIPPCDTRRREKVGALYSAVSGLLAVISRAYPRFLSPVPQNIIITLVIPPCDTRRRKSVSSVQCCF